VFNACLTWARGECKRMERADTPHAILNVLGPLLDLVRFPVNKLITAISHQINHFQSITRRWEQTMDVEFLTTVVDESKLLTSEKVPYFPSRERIV
jgi:hypothetical protein